MSSPQISERRLAANRANALKSTGPRTPAGKQRVSQNACTHRLYAKVHALAPKFQAWALARAERISSQYQEPVLRALHFQLWIAQAFCEVVWAHQNALINQSEAMYPDDRELAHWSVL